MKRFKISLLIFFTLLFSVGAVNAQDVIITGVSSTPVSCGEGSDGTLTVSVSGGVGQYSYLLVQGAVAVESAGPMTASTFTFTGHEKYTNYIIIVSDQSTGTSDGFSFGTIDGAESILITSVIQTDISCNGVNDGTINVTAIGEQGNYIFDLSGAETHSNETGSFDNLQEGNYEVTVRDRDGCPSFDRTPILNINNPTPVTITVNNVSPVDCFGENSGSIAITPGGGVPGGGTGYTYSWTGPNGFTSGAEDITNLEAGDYFITVFDGNLCQVNAGPITITQPPQLTALLNSSSDVSCYGGDNGSASMTPGGGTGGYIYSWDGQDNGLVSGDEDPTDLIADTYNLTIYDASGCSRTFIDFVEIVEPAIIEASVLSFIDVSCNGESDGSADLSPSGGLAPYTFSWTGRTSSYVSGDQNPINMPADIYDLSITDANGCNMAFPGILNISEPPALSLTVNSTSDVSCFGGSDGGANITITGGTPLYNISWTGTGTGHLSTGLTPNNLVADSYDINVTDANGCLQSFPGQLSIAEPADILVTVDNVIPVDCMGDETGAIEIIVAGGTPLYTFLWSGPNGFTASTQDIAMLAEGSYSLTVSDANGCAKNYVNLATITTNPAINVTFNISNVTCNGLTDGAIQSTVSGGTPNYTFSWTGPFGFTSPNEDLSGLSPGIYILTVSDALGCSAEMPPQFVTEPLAITASTSQVDIDCFGAGNGSVNLSSAGGVLPHLFAWTGPGGFTESTEDISMLEAGSYSVSITDANGCMVPFPSLATILEPLEIALSPVKTDISCGGLSDGAVSITVTGGTLPYSYNWTGPAGFSSTQKDITGLAAGTYNLVITDGNGCIMNFPGVATIIEPPAISATLISQTDILCNGEASGAITINTNGGTGLLLFAWTNEAGTTVSSDEDPTGLFAGTYSLTITDANGCSMVYPAMVTLNQAPAIVSSLVETHVSCFGNGDGTITVTTSGGTGSYEYSINGNLDPSYQPGNVFNNLGPGLYTIWTRDANLCAVSNTISIIEPAQITILEEIVGGPIVCYGDASGTISINGVSGGVQPYLYSINNGVDFYPTSLFTDLPAGDYQTVIRDASGCEILGKLNVITQAARLTIDNYVQLDVSTCFDSPEGSILISATGGFGPKTYLLNGSISNTTGNFQNLPGGAYTINISDLNACTLDTSVVILAPPPIVVDNIILTDVTGCFGETNGVVSVAGSGGTGSITYSLNGSPFQSPGTFSGLAAGSFTITIKDDNDCSLDTIVSLLQPEPIVIASEIVTPISCAGAADGAIQILTSGGSDPMKFTLNPGGTSNATGRFGLLAPGGYTVDVSDVEGCGPQSSSLITLVDPPIFLLDSVSDINITCNGASNGAIDIYVSGGIPPYEYSVDNQASWTSDSSFAGLLPGSYEVYARDANLCTVYGGLITMTDPALLTISASATDIALCSGDSSGIIEISGSGGTGLLLYSLNGTSFQSSGTFAMLPAGDYTAYVLDEGGCTATQAVSITEPEAVMATIIKTDATFGNLGSINFSATSGGIEPYEYTIGGPGGSFSSETFYSDLEVGIYHAIARDANGCIDEEMVNILDVLPLDVVVNVTDISCFGELDGSIEMLPQDAEGSVEYSIDSGVTFVPNALFTDLAGNTSYYLVARDAAGKVFSGIANILEPAEISLSRTISPAECNAFSETGAIQITVSGGTPGYTYLWSDGSTEEDRNGILAGTYTLQTSDANMCTRIDTMLVNSEVLVDAFAGNDTTICYGASIQLYGEGGHTAFWSPTTFLSDPDIANPMAIEVTQGTTYILTISEEASVYGCFNTDTVTISVHPQTGLEVTQDTFIIRGASIELEAIGGPFISYRWDPAEGLDNSTIPNPVASPQQSTSYTVYALNENNCEESAMISLEVIEDITAYNVFSPNGDGINDYFDIKNADRFPEILVEVYSRWGDMLFQSVGYDDSKRWDGSTRGTEAPLGTYYFVIIPFSGAKPITGNVTIIR
ncbi:MAG: gliding motility-associated C-terminal domain-containing protein [Bacteroides sp.]|nr:gliding motility-associated C-terminal domain-containing protein [Bacteroides sp.]